LDMHPVQLSMKNSILKSGNHVDLSYFMFLISFETYAFAYQYC
jgi:hypothetical protein